MIFRESNEFFDAGFRIFVRSPPPLPGHILRRLDVLELRRTPTCGRRTRWIPAKYYYFFHFLRLQRSLATRRWRWA